MAKAATKTALRAPAYAGREFGAKGVRLAVLPPAERLALRAPSASLAALSKALGVGLPTKANRSAAAGTRVALWLGPDEWLVIDDGGNDLLADLAAVKALHSAVGVSHRNVGIVVTGPAALATLSAGCPQDLSLAVFPVGACTRTLLGKVEIVVLRTSEEDFRVECWRSFSDYVLAYLTEAASNAAI